ncbi:MAG TPA: ferredoxin [Streptosporangiaceae bacterium]|nr:ferredoxin [Streptosporangiaceae bacterium]
MRVIADRDICIGAGNCVLTVPEVFDQDDDEGLVEVIDPDPAAGLRDKVREAVARCPSGAIKAIDTSEPDD